MESVKDFRAGNHDHFSHACHKCDLGLQHILQQMVVVSKNHDLCFSLFVFHGEGSGSIKKLSEKMINGQCPVRESKMIQRWMKRTDRSTEPTNGSENT